MCRKLIKNLIRSVRGVANRPSLGSGVGSDGFYRLVRRGALPQVQTGRLVMCESIRSGAGHTVFTHEHTSGRYDTAHRSALIKTCVCVCVCGRVFIRLHVCEAKDNKRSAACNRCRSWLELIRCYQRAQRRLQHKPRREPTDLKSRVEKHWACLIVVLGWRLEAADQSQHCYRQHPDLPANTLYLLSVCLGEEQRRRGVRLG